MQRRPLLLALGLAAAAPAAGLTAYGRQSAFAAGPNPDPDHDPVTDLGEPVHKIQTLATGVGAAPDGTPLGYYVVSGNPNVTAEFTVVDLRTGANLLQTRVPYGRSSQRALAQSPVDGAVYFGTSDEGHLYRYRPGGDQVEHLGAIPGAELAWSMAVGEDGTVWFGTYPSGSLYSLDPVTAELTHHGQALADEQYIDSIAPVGDTIWVGTQPNAKLATFDRATGEFTEVAMPDGHAGTAISSLDVRAGLLFVSTTSLYVRDLAAGTWTDEITGANANVSPVDPRDPDAIYLRQGTEIKRYALSTGELTGTGNRPNATPEAWGWIDRDGTGEYPMLAMTYWNGGRTYGLTLHGEKGFYLAPDLMGAGAPLISLGTGPLGNIYAGAFLSPPGMGKYDPDGEGFELLTGTSQVEGYGTFDGKLVFGRYPQGSVYLYDPAQPWSGTNPAAPLELGEEQSRPQVFLELPAIPGTVAVATVPTPGRHGGAISLWQPYLRTHRVHRNVVTDQTPASLVLHDGHLIGGTSIQGGYGIDPVTDQAVLFAWDPVTATTLWTSPAIVGAQVLAGLGIDEVGHLWGVADGRTVFEFDLVARQVVRTVTIDVNATIPRYGDDDRLLFDHGRLFGSVADRLFVLDRVTGVVTSLYGKGSGREDGVEAVMELARDRHGDLYVIGASTHLVRYALPDDVTAPAVAIRSEEVGARGAVIWLTVSDDTDPAPRLEVRFGDGLWRGHRSDRPLRVPAGVTLEYRAVDRAWNSSPVGRYVAPAHR